MLVIDYHEKCALLNSRWVQSQTPTDDQNVYSILNSIDGWMHIAEPSRLWTIKSVLRHMTGWGTTHFKCCAWKFHDILRGENKILDRRIYLRCCIPIIDKICVLYLSRNGEIRVALFIKFEKFHGNFVPYKLLCTENCGWKQGDELSQSHLSAEVKTST